MCQDPGSHGRWWSGTFTERMLASDLAVLLPDRTSWPAPSNIIVVRDEDGLALIEAGLGTTHAVNELSRALERLGLHLEDVHTLICTHAHVDHAGGLAPLAEGRRVVIPATSRKMLEDPSLMAAAILPGEVTKLEPALREFDVDAHFRADCGASALPPDAAIEEIEAGEFLRLGHYEWEAIATPGHEAHLLSYFEHTRRALVYSDLLVSRGTAIPWYAPGGGGTEGYLRGLDAVSGKRAVVGLSGHGRLLESEDEVRAAVLATAERIVERRDRFVTALKQGPVTFRELERLIYPPVVHEVIPWASTVAATHLLEALAGGWVDTDISGDSPPVFAARKSVSE